MTTGSAAGGGAGSASDPRQASQFWGERYRANPQRCGRRDQLRAGAARHRPARAGGGGARAGVDPQRRATWSSLGAYGRALADVGKHEQALEVLNRAHTPDRPDWRILNAQGAVLDQLGRHQEAQRYYATRAADRAGGAFGAVQSRTVLCAVEEPAGGGGDAQARGGRHAVPIRACAATSRWWSGCKAASPEAEAIARADLPPDQAAANVAYLREMVSRQSAAQGRSQPQPKRGGVGGPAS